MKVAAFCGAVAAAGTCLLWIHLDPFRALNVYAHTAYYFMLALFLTWGIVTGRELCRAGFEPLQLLTARAGE